MAKLSIAPAPEPTTQNELDSHVEATRQRERAPRISIWEPTGSKEKKAPIVAIPIADAMIEVILRPVTEGHRDGNDRKERELAALFATLTPVESWTLQRRLANPIAGDLLAATFMRMIIERRIRLLAFLARNRVTRR